MKTFEEIIDINLEQQFEVEPPPIAPMEIETEPTELEKTMSNIDAIQESWNKPQEEIPTEPYVPTQEELDMIKNEQRKAEIKTRLDQLSEDIVQYEAGENVPDITKRKAEFIMLHNELRELEGKQPRSIR